MELTEIVRCMSCRKPLELEHGENGEQRCKHCGWVAGTEILDFLVDPDLRDERDHYDAKWSKDWFDGTHRFEAPADPAALRQLWTADPRSPALPAVRERIGDVRDKVVVLLGNGVSLKELSLLQDGPRLLVYTDLSLAAMKVVRDYARDLGQEENLVFAAIDAMDMPFEDGSVDLVYGVYFVSQLPDVDGFLKETARILKPGGRAVFKDRAYGPLVDRAKRGVLRPMRRAVHKWKGLSPGDVRFMATGGFREDELARQMRAVGGQPFFERDGLLHYAVSLSSRVFSGRDSRWRLMDSTWERDDGSWRLRVRHARFLSAVHRMDVALERLEPFRENEIRLLWGFDLAGSAPGSPAADATAAAVPEASPSSS